MEEENNLEYQKAVFLDKYDSKNTLAYKYDQVNIAFPVAEDTKIGDVLRLEQEPGNEYDSHAVRVMNGKTRIGYLYRGKMQDMVNDFIDRDQPVMARVDSVSSDSISIAIAFYKPGGKLKQEPASSQTKQPKEEEVMMKTSNQKYCKHCGELIDADCVICPKCGKQVEELKSAAQPNITINNSATAVNNGGEIVSPKSWLVTLLLCLFLGTIGIHRFYAGKIWTGILMIIISVTGVGFVITGIWEIVDLIMIILSKFKDKQGRPIKR